jgi:hypothetical protein
VPPFGPNGEEARRTPPGEHPDSLATVALCFQCKATISADPAAPVNTQDLAAVPSADTVDDRDELVEAVV